MTVNQITFLRERDYLAVSITHFFVDVLNSGRNLLVAILAITLSLTNAQVGIALLLYNVGSALAQPLFGWLADRIGARWLVVGGMGWMIFFYVVASLAGDWPALVALTIASLGSGAFHPTGTMVASQVSHSHRNKATAVFFMAGQLGLFFGPILTGIVLEQFGRPGYLVLPALSFIALASGWQWLIDRPVPHYANDVTPATLPHSIDHPHVRGNGGTGELGRRGERMSTVQISPLTNKPTNSPTRKLANSQTRKLARQTFLLSIIIVTGSTLSIAAITFAPKLFTELQYEPGYVGLLSGLFMMGSAVGGVIGGALADHIHGKWVILLGMAGVILPVYFYIPLAGWERFVLLLLAGFFSGMPHTVLVLMIQSLLPGRRATASGLALGFMFFSGAVGSYFLGIIADKVGLGPALQGTAALPIIAILATLLLPHGVSE